MFGMSRDDERVERSGLVTLLTVVSSSCKTWSYSDIATQKIIAVTSSKQCIHFLRSLLWPPTSNNLKKKTKIKNQLMK